jgi:2-succinyl-5-enolpyruvyl-6-hydroxy-3-cyclohexene-1-carboxylate synthase
VHFLANRGVSGIDGVVSSALGASVVSEGRLVLLIGDLSFYHDMNGLLAAKRFGLDATIVLLNNDGGGIFSFLPQADGGEHFEALFGTPHGLDFAPVARLYSLQYMKASTREQYRAALQRSFETQGVSIIEVRTGRVENVELHRRLWRDVSAAAAEALV